MKKKRSGHSVFSFLELPPDTVSNTPSFLLCGDEELIIDGKCSLVSYSEECVVFDISRKGKCLVVCGKELCLRVLGAQACSVRGKISSLSFEEEK